jgi:hypothetical protein
MAEVVRKDAPQFRALSATFADGRMVHVYFCVEQQLSTDRATTVTS